MQATNSPLTSNNHVFFSEENNVRGRSPCRGPPAAQARGDARAYIPRRQPAEHQFSSVSQSTARDDRHACCATLAYSYLQTFQHAIQTAKQHGDRSLTEVGTFNSVCYILGVGGRGTRKFWVSREFSRLKSVETPELRQLARESCVLSA